MAAAADTMLLGRNTWQEFAGYWPNADPRRRAGAGFMNDTRKLVVSDTLDRVDAWQNSTIVKGDPAEELTEIKAGDGKDISMIGSLTLTRTLLHAKLVDELHLLVHPIAARAPAPASSTAATTSPCNSCPPRPSPPASSTPCTARPKPFGLRVHLGW